MSITFKLKDFDGPLDLLLTLVSKAKIDIRDVFVSQITDEYIDFVNNSIDLDMDDATDFLVMAATLLEIKSRTMLPKPPALDEGEEDPEEVLIRRLEEYKKIREAADKLQEFEHSSQNMFVKLPEEFSLPQQQFELKKITMEQLASAFAMVLQRKENYDSQHEGNRYAPRDIHRDEHNVDECMLSILKKLQSCDAVSFDKTFSQCPSREEVVTLFLALLELLKLGEAHIEQETTYGSIMLIRGKAQEETMEVDNENG